MGSIDGTEICELAVLHIRSKLENILPKVNCGLYWHDGQTLLSSFNGQKMNTKKKIIIKISKYIGVTIDIQTNLKETNSLDLKETDRFTEPTNCPVIHCKSLNSYQIPKSF